MSRPAAEEAGIKLNLLIAYPYLTDTLLAGVQALGAGCRFIIDSGAFTAWKTGRAITLDDYCRFLERLPFAPWRYFVLDVIGDPAASLRHYQTMRARGFNPIPIVTRGGPGIFAEMDAYYETSDVVAIGGMVGGTVRPAPFVKAVLAHAAGRRLHLLGFTDFTWLKHARPYMADSSSWMAAARYGYLYAYTGFGQFLKLHKRDLLHQPPPPVLVQIARQWGFDPYALAEEANWRGNDSLSVWLTTTSWCRASLDAEQNLGVKLFLAQAWSRLDILATCFRIAQGEVSGEAARQAALRGQR